MYHDFYQKWSYYSQIFCTFVSFFQDISSHWLPEHVPEAMCYASDRILFLEMVTLRSLKQLCTFFTNFSHFFHRFFLFSDYERHPTIAWTFAIVIRQKYGILGVMQSNRGDSTVEKFTKCGVAHQIPPDLSVRHMEQKSWKKPQISLTSIWTTFW